MFPLAFDRIWRVREDIRLVGSPGDFMAFLLLTLDLKSGSQ